MKSPFQPEIRRKAGRKWDSSASVSDRKKVDARNKRLLAAGAFIAAGNAATAEGLGRASVGYRFAQSLKQPFELGHPFPEGA